MYDIAISSDGQLFATAGKGIQLLKARSGKRHALLGVGNMVANSVAFSPANASQPLLLAAGLDDEIVRVWDSRNGVCVAEIRGYDGKIGCVDFSPNGRLLASGSDDNSVRLWRTDDWHAPPAVLNGHIDFVTSVSFSCNGRLLASCSMDGTVRLWHVSDTAATAGPILNVGRVVWWCVTFSPVDSSLLACGGCGGSLALARVGTGTIAVERVLQGHTSGVCGVAFSPCGRTLASSSHDETMRLWSVASGACLRVLGHKDRVTSVAFFPDGNQLASGSWDKTVRTWTVCPWSDHNHRLFGTQLKHKVFLLMCVRARLMAGDKPELPIELWLMVFEWLALSTKL